MDKDYFDQSNNWDASRVEASEKSERRAWWVATAAAVLALLSWGTIALMMPLKEKVPYLYRENTATGVVDTITTLADDKVTFDDVRDKYWVTQYLRKREGYDWYTLNDDYNQVEWLSSPQVAADYDLLFKGPSSIDKTNGSQVLTQIDIVSVVPNGHGTATIRFIRRTRRLDQPNLDPQVSHWVATLTYEYRNPSKLPEKVRLVNPFGFQVIAYRIDPESTGGAK
jgi:type IV secretion system protein VirB8